MTFLRTRQEHWKPTLEAVQRFGHRATECVIHLSESEAEAFVAGHDRELDWDGDWGYLIVTHDVASVSTSTANCARRYQRGAGGTSSAP